MKIYINVETNENKQQFKGKTPINADLIIEKLKEDAQKKHFADVLNDLIKINDNIDFI